VMGSFNFPYSASAMVVNFESFWVLMVLYQMVMAREKKTPRHLGTLALSCGCMLLANPFTVLTMPVVYFYVWRDLGIRKMKQLLFFSISAGLPLIPLFIYNHINFDFFLSSNRNHLAPIWTDPNLFMGVFGMPEFGRIKEVFGPGTRSLLTTVPFLYLSIFAFSKRLNRGISFPVPLLPYVGSIFLTFFALLLTFNGWHGGACFGPRYFILVLPLIALITVPFYIRNPLFYSLFVSWSILVMGVASSRGIWLDPENKNPLRTIFKDINGEPSFLWPSFVGAAPSFNIYDLGDLLNIPGYWSLAPLIVLHVLFVVYLMNSRFRFSEKIMSLLETGRRQPPPVHE
jgi:hypothetical protein